jgi:hypothetical protein
MINKDSIGWAIGRADEFSRTYEENHLQVQY